ncbi:LPS-assembly protein [Lebetimonas natsushimae]|uniref:LPS-assembly protein n=1 Tax=Lebetimonas natsushimae TaxID=1936991 RepID=A0A292YAZ2_9BACT|nr:LPS-assembly protein LptD [Lebetimonas natsushimae]GAX88132.1 LPS-assembly protein [Lebetimonas natsushimae]
MLLRVISLLLIPFFLFALKIYSKKTIQQNGKYILDKPLIIYNNNSFIEAKKGIIENNHIIKLYGNVTVFYNSQDILLADSLIAYSKEKIFLKNIFFYDKNIDGWVRSIKAISKKNILYFNSPYFSTCCSTNPDWFIKSSSGNYNRSTKLLKLKNIVLVIHNIPVFYFPYWQVSFDKTRRSGLLRPYIGYSNKEGVLYSQPVYFVTSINTDLEIIPTIRNKRGKGIYSIFRFVDSPYSEGKIKFGIFGDKNYYYEKYDLAHRKHYGYSIYYLRNKLFNNDKLYLNLKYANDVDYFYLDAYNYKFDSSYLTDKIITSNLNYINIKNKNYYGIYFKYFIDTSLLNNDTTWQILPQLNYHRFLEKRGILLDSLDLNIYNYYRKKGSNFILQDINLPIGLYNSFFNDYLKFKLTETLYEGYGKYYQENNLGISKYLYLTTQFKFFTSLAKNFNYFIHVINPSISINIKNYSNKKIYSDLIDVPEMKNYILFNLFQIINFENLYINHTLNQIYYLDEKRLGELENLIDIKYLDYYINENNKYSMKDRKVIYNNIKFGYNNNIFDYFISNIYQRQVSKTVTVGSGYKPNLYKRYFFEYSYDLNNKYSKYWLIGVSMNKKCYKYTISFKQNRIPILESTGTNYRKDNIINLSVEFYPVGGIDQSFIFKGKE